MDTRTGKISDFANYVALQLALEENPHMVQITLEERSKLARYDESSRPAKLVQLRATSASRNKAKAARKARRIQRRK